VDLGAVGGVPRDGGFVGVVNSDWVPLFWGWGRLLESALGELGVTEQDQPVSRLPNPTWHLCA
jgi:hypothetical protein